MNSPTSKSDPHIQSHDHPNIPEASSPPDRRTTSHSDEEVILASSRPKKRAGRKKFKETRHPVYRGIRQRNSNKWVCELREPSQQKRIWLGTYPTAEMAARAHDVAALALRGPIACLNFADSMSRLPIPTSKDAKEVRRAAMEAAEAFRPREVEERRNVVSDSCSQVDDKSVVSEFDLNNYMGGVEGGVLMSPPPSLEGSFHCDDVESDAEVELWSYSI